MFEGYIANKLANKMFEKEVFSIVKKNAFCAAIVMSLPLFGIDWILFMIILWHMYSAICEKVGTTLKMSSIIVGVIVNIIVGVALDIVLTFIPLLIGFIVYAQFYFSGKAFIEILKQIRE